MRSGVVLPLELLGGELRLLTGELELGEGSVVAGGMPVVGAWVGLVVDRSVVAVGVEMGSVVVVVGLFLDSGVREGVAILGVASLGLLGGGCRMEGPRVVEREVLGVGAVGEEVLGAEAVGVEVVFEVGGVSEVGEMGGEVVSGGMMPVEGMGPGGEDGVTVGGMVGVGRGMLGVAAEAEEGLLLEWGVEGW